MWLHAANNLLGLVQVLTADCSLQTPMPVRMQMEDRIGAGLSTDTDAHVTVLTGLLTCDNADLLGLVQVLAVQGTM